MIGNRERGWAALGRNRFDIAEKEFRGVLASEPDDAQAHAALALCLCEQERFDEAEREITTAIGLAPDVDFPHSVHARILRDRHRFAEAAKAIAEAIRLDPGDANHRAIAASIHAQQAQWAECLEAADAGLALDPEHDGCTNLRALALTQLGRKDEASATIAGALERAPENGQTHANQGWALLHRNDPTAALDHFKEALRLDPSNEWAREGLLTALKARNPLFRGLLAYFLFMSRQRGAVQWVIILGVLFGQRLLNAIATSHPEYGIVIYPLLAVIAVAVFSTWLANPLMNLVMRFDPYGRHALTRDQTWQANLIGSCLLAAAGLFATELTLGIHHLGSLLVLLLSIPLTTIHQASVGWPRRLCVAVALAFTAIAAFEAYVLCSTHGIAPGVFRSDGEEALIGFAMLLLPIFTLGILVWSIAAGFVVRMQPER